MTKKFDKLDEVFNVSGEIVSTNIEEVLLKLINEE